jgi:DNA-binding SARP family transcriptional activator
MGSPRLLSADAERELERKQAACVAYLAIEGAQSRSRMATLLWPEAPEDKARANLRQLVRRLRVAAEDDVVTRGDSLGLAPGVQTDVATFVTWAAEQNWPRLIVERGTLLAGVQFDDCPDLDDWLTLTRTRFAWTMAHALNVEASRLESARGAMAAMPLLIRWIELDPVSEEAYRRVMRAHFANGDRGAALRAFADCREALRARLGVEPVDETLALADEIKEARGASGHRVIRSRGPQPIPLSVLRPPVLVGRAQAWARIEEGFRAGKMIMVSGPGGIGKTRLVQDFVAQQAGYDTRYLSSRPGDRELPYVHFARQWRHEIAVVPDCVHRLAPWVRCELSRILPELGDPPPPIATAAERTRFFEANLEMAKAARDRHMAVVSDDVHHLDAASHELGIFMGMYFISESSPFRSISSFRPDEMSPTTLELLRAYVDAGQAVHVELTALSEGELRELLVGMDLPEVARDAERLHAHTGGIPFFLVETLKAHFEEGRPRELPEQLTPTERVRMTIERRLSRLHPHALRLLRAAALLDQPLRVRQAIELIEGDAASLGRAWNELERGLLLRSGTVAHDLLRSVILDAMPEPERVLLHERVAQALERAGAHPARVARHFAAAGQRNRAAQRFVAAADWARRMLRPDEEQTFRQLAEEVVQPAGLP